MAITINQAPDYGESLHFHMWHVVTSSNVSNSGFRYVFDVYVGGNLVARIRQVARPDNNKGTLDAAPIIRAYLNNYFAQNNTYLSEMLYLTTNDIAVEYEVQYGEEYGGTLYPNLMSATYKGYNCYPGLFKAGSYLPLFSKMYSIITDRDKDIFVTRGQSVLIPYLNDAAGNDIGVQIERYDTDGAFIDNNGFNLTGLNELVILAFSPDSINANIVIPGAPVPFIHDGVGSYTITIVGDPTFNTTSETYRVWFKCYKHEPIYLHFLNKYGGFDTAMFEMVNRLNETYDRKKHQRLGFEFSSNFLGDYNPLSNVYFEQNVNHVVDQAFGAKMISGYVSENNYKWLNQLLKSTQIYFEKDSYLYPVLIKDTRWEEKKAAADKMFNLEMEIEFSHTLNSQFR